MQQTMSPRRETWQRFTPFHGQRNLHLLVLEIADDLDQGDRDVAGIKAQIVELRDHFDKRMAKLTGIATGLLISVCTGVLLIGIQIATGR
jgi:hypothetical protein